MISKFTFLSGHKLIVRCMRPFMPRQYRHFKESFSTDLADIRLLTSVGSSHVDCQVTVTPESSPTCCTRKRLLTRVDSHVNRQGILNYETFSTCFAKVRPLTGVWSSHMNCQLTTLFVCSPTHVANIRLLPCVDYWMSSQCWHLIESFPANLTKEGLLTCVGHQVSF